ncbi:high affinity phosphodiesterase [Phyllosticta citricarpa]
MDHGACNVIYLDRRAHPERVRRDNVAAGMNARNARSASSQGYFNVRKADTVEVLSNVETLLSIFNEVDVHRSGSACLDSIWNLCNTTNLDNCPVLVLIDLPYDEERRMKRLSREPRTPSPTAARGTPDVIEPEDLYGMHLLRHISAEIQDHRLPRLIIPVIILSGLNREETGSNTSSPTPGGSRVLTDTVRLVRYLDAGAVDVLASPLSKDHIHGLAVHAYRINKEVMREKSSFLASKKARKVSWVGVNEEKPFAYLREAMVSNLMGNICCPDTAQDTLDPGDVEVSVERRKEIARAVGTWSFSAHDFNDDELLYASLVMLQHALSMPEVERWRMAEDDLMIFLLASRSAYNEFVLYHNFRHVVDVLQALFFFLLQVGALPAYPAGAPSTVLKQPPISSLLKPFDALTLLISAIGHDVGHPGVNNAFLVALNAPLAQLYNDRSVLESFHCAAYSQILRRYWPGAFADVAMRKLMITSILATDMGLHFKYMADLGNLQEKLAQNQGGMNGWVQKVLDDNRDLLCGLLIKCADISNVARNFNTAARWAAILTDEFSNQGQMEEELQVPTCLVGGPPVRDDIVKMGESQIGFMNIFARPLFKAVADILPSMRFAVDEIITNEGIWKERIDQERDKQKPKTDSSIGGFENSLILEQARNEESPDLEEVAESRPSQPDRTQSNTSSVKRRSLFLPTRVNGSDSSGRSSRGPSSPTETRRSSLAAIPIPRHLTPGNGNSNSPSRRGSADASLTTILVTQDPSKPSENVKKKGLRLRSQSPLSKRRKSRQEAPSNLQISSRPDSPPQMPDSPGFPPTANGQVHVSKGYRAPHSGPNSPANFDPKHLTPPAVPESRPMPPKPHTSDGSSQAPGALSGMHAPAETQSRWKRNRHNRKGSLTPAAADAVATPATGTSKSSTLYQDDPHTFEGTGEAPAQSRPKSRGGVLGRFWRRRIRGDKSQDMPDVSTAGTSTGQDQPPLSPAPPKTPVTSGAAGGRRGSMPLLPGSFPDTPPRFQRAAEER